MLSNEKNKWRRMDFHLMFLLWCFFLEFSVVVVPLLLISLIVFFTFIMLEVFCSILKLIAASVRFLFFSHYIKSFSLSFFISCISFVFRSIFWFFGFFCMLRIEHWNICVWKVLNISTRFYLKCFVIGHDSCIVILYNVCRSVWTRLKQKCLYIYILLLCVIIVDECVCVCVYIELRWKKLIGFAHYHIYGSGWFFSFRFHSLLFFSFFFSIYLVIIW